MGAVPWVSHEPEAPQSSWDHQMAKDSSGWFRPSWPITLSHTVLVGTCRRRSRPCPPHRRTLCCGYVRLKLTGPRPLAIQIENPDGAVVLLRFTLKRRKLPHAAVDLRGVHTCLSSGRQCWIALLPLSILQLPHEATCCMVRHQQCWSVR